MSSIIKKRVLLIIALGLIFTSAFIWFNVSQKSGAGYANAGVRAPGPAEKKIVLKNLRMA